MRTFCWTLVLLTVVGISPSWAAGRAQTAAQGIMTNNDVIDLVKSGMSADIIVAKIRTSTCQFDTSAAALKSLKGAGVPDPVIVAMVDPSGKSAGPSDVSNPVNPDDPFAHVRVYRQRLLPGSNFNPPIFVDDKEVFKLANAKRCSVKVTPGHHVVTSDDKSSRIEIDAKPGQEFYVSVQELPGGFFKGRGKLTLMSNQQGKPEYKLEKPLEDDKKTATDMIEPDTGDAPAADQKN